MPLCCKMSTKQTGKALRIQNPLIQELDSTADSGNGISEQIGGIVKHIG